MEQGRGSKSKKESKYMPVEGSQKEKNRETTRERSKKEFPRHEPREDPKKDDMKDNLKDRPKDVSKISGMKGIPTVSENKDPRDVSKKGPRKESSSIRDNDHIVVIHKSISTSHKLSTSISRLVDESKDVNLDMRARNGDATKSGKGPGRSWNDETVADSRIWSEKLQNETKRKGRSFDNEKNSEIDRLVLKRHDSARFQDSKHLDKNDGWKDYARSYHGEPKLKRRRSRSRDLDRERHDRSNLLRDRRRRLKLRRCLYRRLY